MITTFEDQIQPLREPTCRMLQNLRFAVHRVGYNYLVLLICRYALDNTKSLTKELYPFAAQYYSYSSWQAVEHAVRVAILDAWERREMDTWEEYFPGMKKPPSNKQFIAVLAERLKNTPPV